MQKKIPEECCFLLKIVKLFCVLLLLCVPLRDNLQYEEEYPYSIHHNTYEQLCP